MSNQIVISSGAKVRNLDGVLTGTSGIVNSLGINVPDGIPQLDGSGKILVSQLPNSVMEYKGTWNAATNTPTLANGTGNAGDVYLCNVAGTVNFGAGPITFAVGDQVLYSGTTWERASGATGTVTSVSVTESGDALTITGSPITTSGTINIGFAGTGAQYVKGDGTLATFPTTIDQAKRLITEVYNSTGSTLTKGTVVYINGGQGNLPTITKAIATGDSTSAQTYGVVQSDITNNNNGFVVVLGSLTDIDTQAYSVGTQLYLSGSTAGAWTSTKPSAPIHLVYVGIVVRSHPTQGVVEIRIQNGYELEELHDVAITSVANNDGIFYNSSNDLWENKTIGEVLGYTPANDSLVVHLAGTETITGAKTFSNLLTLNNKLYLQTDLGSNGIYLQSYNSNEFTIGTISGGTTYLKNFILPISTDLDYTFPSTSGTIALTSNLSSYLPLSGGTLTGALSGTSATFSGGVTSNATTSVSFYSGTYVSNTLGDGSFATYSGRIRENASYALNIDLYDRTAATWRTPLSFNNTGGAATFSSSVTATSLIVGSTPILYGNVAIKSNSATSYFGLNVIANGNNNFIALNHTGSVGVIETEFSTGGSHTPIALVTGGSERMRITSGGNVLIAKTTDNGLGDKLQILGEISVSGSVAAYSYYDRGNGERYTMYANAGFTNFYYGSNIASISMTTGVYTPLSDINKKKDFEESTIGLNEILKLKPTLYRMKTQDESFSKELGFIAQEVKEFIPQAYVENDDFIGLNYNPIVAALVKAIQEQQAQIEELKAKIK